MWTIGISPVATGNSWRYPPWLTSSSRRLVVVIIFLSIMPDIFLRTSYQISSSNYIKVLDRVTTRSIRWFFLLQSVCGPSLVRSNSGVDGREYHSYFNPKIWPLNTFELPPFDYYFWTVAERKTVQRPNTIEHYLKAITMVAPVKVLRIPSIQLIPMLRVECTRSRGGAFYNFINFF